MISTWKHPYKDGIDTRMGIYARLVIPAKSGIQERLGILAKIGIYETVCLPWVNIKMDIYARVALNLKVSINANLKNHVKLCIHAKMSFPERIDIDVKMNIHERIGNPAKVGTDASMKIHTRINTHTKMGTHAHLAKDEHPCKRHVDAIGEPSRRNTFKSSSDRKSQISEPSVVVWWKLGNSEKGAGWGSLVAHELDSRHFLIKRPWKGPIPIRHCRISRYGVIQGH